jgi:hypothetical protein
MIERLRARAEYRNRDEAEVARLLRSVGPAVAPPAFEQRVLESLGGPRRLGPRAMRIATVASVPMVATAILAATLAVIYGRDARPRHSKAPAAQPSVSSQLAVASPLPLAVDDVRSPAEAVSPAEDRTASRLEPIAEPTAPPRKLSPGNRRQQAVSSRSHATPMADSTSSMEVPGSPAPSTDSDAAEARAAAAPAEEASIVLAALRALRRSHDPVRASVLIARYLESFPQGALVQEATAIAIQASLVRGDRESAARLAKEYLDRYPNGRFVPLARKAVAGPRP